MTRIDLALNAMLSPQQGGYDQGATEFLDWLTALRRVPGFDVDWGIQPNPVGQFFSVWRDREAYTDVFRKQNAGETESLVIKAVEASADMFYAAGYTWRTDWIDKLDCEINHAHPQMGTAASMYVGMIDATTRWKRLQHLSFGPGVYARDHHPLDRSRAGINWMGWVPFTFSASDVPEAEIVRPMNGGTLVVTQTAFWQAWEANPTYSRAAIQRAQDVEIRLNLLGVLPTGDDLRGGNWGR